MSNFQTPDLPAIRMSVWLWLVLLVFVLAVLSNVSTRVNFIVKYAYLYCAYMTVSTFVIPFCLARPRHPQNGAITARILQLVNRLVRIVAMHGVRVEILRSFNTRFPLLSP